jgi:hypothetical protein
VACDTVSISTYLATNYSYDSYIDLVEPFVGNDLSEAERYTNYGCYENADQSAFVIYLVRLNPATTVGGQFSYDSQEVRLER